MRQLFFSILFSGFSVAAIAQQDSAASNTHTPCLSNALSVIPFQATENGIGIGASYERALDKKGLLAFYIPAIVTFNVANTNRIYDYNTGNYNTGKTDAVFYTMPGIKFYPTGCYGKVKYATGASFVVGSGRQSSYTTDIGGLNTTELVQPHFFIGAMWQNSLSVNIYARVYLAAEFGIGSTFINKAGGAPESNETLVQGGLKAGFRF